MKASGCFDCLKNTPKCPLCLEEGHRAQDLIFNHALSRAAEWFQRQRISRAETEEIEIPKQHSIDESLVEKLLDEAKQEAARR